MTRKRPLFSSSNQSPEIHRTRWILQKKGAVKEFLSGGDMKRWLAVGVVALGTLGLLMMRSTKSAGAAHQGGVPRTCTVAAHSKNTGAGCRRSYRSFHGIPQAPAPDFRHPGQQLDGDCEHRSGQSRSER